MRLIDAYALEDEFGISDEDLIAKEAIRTAPTIDAVEVVRCKDCKHFRHYGRTSLLINGKTSRLDGVRGVLDTTKNTG